MFSLYRNCKNVIVKSKQPQLVVGAALDVHRGASLAHMRTSDTLIVLGLRYFLNCFSSLCVDKYRGATCQK
jgi:hypothetical protein